MNLWPITERELRLNARRPRTYHFRTLTAAVVVLTSLGMLYAGFARVLSPGSAGRGLFLILSCVGAAYVLFDGPLMTGDCLSSEKREGTLGLLRMTGLSAGEIVLGKLLSRVTHSGYCLIAAVPALSIALFLGGVTGSEVFGMSAVLLNGLFLSAAAGMFTSSICRQEQRALGWAMILSIVLAAGLPALGWGISILNQTRTVHPLFLVLSPGGAFLHLLNFGPFASAGFSLPESIATTHLLGWGFLAGASVGLNFSADESFGAERNRASAPMTRNSVRRPAKESTARHRRPFRIEQNPIVRMNRARGRTGLGIAPGILVFGLTWGLGWFWGQSRWLDWGVFVASMALLHLVLMFFLTIQACRGPSEDRRERILEMLLTTPAGPDLYLPGRLLSLKQQCVRPLLLVLAIDLGLLVTGLHEIGPPDSEWLLWIGAFLVLALKLIVDLYVLSWVGIWQGLKQSNTGRAVRRTVFYVLVLKWILLLGILSVLGLATGGRAFQSGAAALIAGAGYAVLLVMSTLHFGALAIGELEDNLRLLALEDGTERSDLSSSWPVTRLPEPCRM